MLILELGAADAAAFRGLRLRSFREEPSTVGYSFEEQSLEPVEVIAALLARKERSPDDFVLGAFVADALGGMVGFERPRRRKRAHRALLRGMYVAPEARGQGIARALAGELLARARRTEGVERVILTVMADNDGAIRLYRSLGFEVWGREPRAMKLDGVYHDELSMGLFLAP